MIKTLYISSFIVVYGIYFTHSLYCVLMNFSHLLKNYTLAARNAFILQLLTEMVETNIIL